MAAEAASAHGVRVVVFEKMATLARRLLRAGVGGLNLTHSEPLEPFLARYGAAADRLRPAIEAFPPSALVAWAEGLGQATFVGTSGRVFPKAMKASPLLRAWTARLLRQGVEFRTGWRWLGFEDGGGLAFETADGPRRFEADAVVLAMGGASWPRLGADGGWTSALAGAEIVPFQPSNCGFDVEWSESFRSRFAGAPLKGIALDFRGRRVRGEALITARGIEGGAVYALSAALRDAIAAEGPVELVVDLRPDLSIAAVRDRLARTRASDSRTNRLRKALGLSPQAIGLVREAGDGADPAMAVKALSLRLIAPAPLDRAISSAGGLGFSALDAQGMLTIRPGVFVAGEMLDWEAPTGGYLLQGCIASGRFVGEAAVRWLADQGDSVIRKTTGSPS